MLTLIPGGARFGKNRHAHLQAQTSRQGLARGRG